MEAHHECDGCRVPVIVVGNEDRSCVSMVRMSCMKRCRSRMKRTFWLFAARRRDAAGRAYRVRTRVAKGCSRPLAGSARDFMCLVPSTMGMDRIGTFIRNVSAQVHVLRPCSTGGKARINGGNGSEASRGRRGRGVCGRLPAIALLLASSHGFAAFQEAPLLAERVARGELPPVEDRLPPEPVVVEPVRSIGT